MHNHTMGIYIQFKFQEIPFVDFLVMDESGKNHCNFGNQMAITPI